MKTKKQTYKSKPVLTEEEKKENKKNRIPPQLQALLYFAFKSHYTSYHVLN